MSKLHEVLAVEPSHEAASTKLLAEAVKTFNGKEGLFKGKTRTLKLFGKDEANKVEFEALEAKDSINQKVAATVPENLNYVATVMARYYDVVAQKEATNQHARADVVINGVTIMADMPATFLLGLETKLKAWRELLEAAPTMLPGLPWVPATELGAYIYKIADPVKDVKTAKTVDHKMLPQPNAQHPAQYVPIDVNKNIGEYSEFTSSGQISTADKAALIDRLDSLLKAVKQARMRANDVEVKQVQVGDSLMGYLFGAWYDPTKMNPEAKV